MLSRFEKAIDYDKSDYDYVTVPFSQYNNVADDIDWALTHMSYHNDSLRKNYTEKRFFNDDVKAVSITYKDGMPYQVSTVISRPMFNGALRICNRFMQVPTYRSKSLIGFDLRTMIEMILSQQEMFSKDNLFISREKNLKTLKLMTSWINHFGNKVWSTQDQKIMVCEGSGCDQYITSNYLKPRSRNL